MENEDILYGYWTGKKTDWSSFLMNIFRKSVIKLETLQGIKYFRRLAYVNTGCSFVDLITVYGISGYQNYIVFLDNDSDDWFSRSNWKKK